MPFDDHFRTIFNPSGDPIVRNNGGGSVGDCWQFGLSVGSCRYRSEQDPVRECR